MTSHFHNGAPYYDFKFCQIWCVKATQDLNFTKSNDI